MSAAKTSTKRTASTAIHRCTYSKWPSRVWCSAADTLFIFFFLRKYVMTLTHFVTCASCNFTVTKMTMFKKGKITVINEAKRKTTQRYRVSQRCWVTVTMETAMSLQLCVCVCVNKWWSYGADGPLETCGLTGEITDSTTVVLSKVLKLRPRALQGLRKLRTSLKNVCHNQRQEGRITHTNFTVWCCPNICNSLSV